jgi:hypothetical protein
MTDGAAALRASGSPTALSRAMVTAAPITSATPAPTLLFELPNIARYDPELWVAALDVNTSKQAVPIEAALDEAFDVLPELVLDALTRRVAHSAIARAGRVWPGAPAHRPGEVVGSRGSGVGCARGGPEEAGELAGDRDDDHVSGLAAVAHSSVDFEQALLAAVGDLQDVVRLPELSVLQGRAESRLTGVVPGGLNQHAGGRASTRSS